MRVSALVFSLLLMFISAAKAEESCNLPADIRSPSLQSIDCKNTTAPDNYALAVSWSPQFCSTVNVRSPKYAIQCSKNKFKFVVHGLWPQKSTARDKCDHPRNCEVSLVADDTIKKMLCIMPSENLIQGEWQKHGTCSGMSSAAYFDKTAELWNKLKKPDIEALLDAQDMVSSDAIAQAFVAANKGSGLKKTAVSVQASDGALTEVLICYDAQFRYSACKPARSASKVKVRVVH